MKKFLFGKIENSKRAGYLWNSISGLILAGQSVLILIVVTRFCDLQSAGVFSIAYAIANLMLTIGKYGMRTYQVSDIENQYSFTEYHFSRIITCILMLLISAGYILYGAILGKYNLNKTFVIGIFCILKAIDAYEDIFFGDYQKKGRLDVGAKALTFRLALSLTILIISLILFKNLMIAASITCICSIFICIWFIIITYPFFRETKRLSCSKVFELLKSCFPVFAGSYLSIYIGNISKYAIDNCLSEELQACYNFIFMPVFLIGLLSSFVYQPLIGKMTLIWENRKIIEFRKMIYQQIALAAGITVILLIGAWLFGIPTLSFLYNTDLTEYKNALLILLFGGGLYAIGFFFTVILTIIRKQVPIIWGYALVSIISKMAANYFVELYEINGASILYTITMGSTVILFGLLIKYYIKKAA